MRASRSSEVRSKPVIFSSRTSGSASFRNWSSLHPRLALSWRRLAWKCGVFCCARPRKAPAASSTTASKSALLHGGAWANAARAPNRATNSAASTRTPARMFAWLSPSPGRATHRPDAGLAQVGCVMLLSRNRKVGLARCSRTGTAYRSRIVSGGSPSSTRPMVMKLDGRPCSCCEADNASRSRRSNGLIGKIAVWPAAR